MDKNEFGFNEPEAPESEPSHQTLRRMAQELGFFETPELQEISRQAVESSSSLDSPEAINRFNELIAQIQILGEPLTEQETPKTGLAQIGLILARAATLFESHRLDDCHDDIDDALTALDNMVSDFPAVGTTIERLEQIRQRLEEIKGGQL